MTDLPKIYFSFFISTLNKMIKIPENAEETAAAAEIKAAAGSPRKIPATERSFISPAPVTPAAKSGQRIRIITGTARSRSAFPEATESNAPCSQPVRMKLFLILFF